MPLIFFDGFDDGGTQWTFTVNQIGGNGRFSQRYSPTATQNGIYFIPAAQESDTICVGVAFCTDAVQGEVISLMSDGAATNHLNINLNSGGIIQLRRGSTELAVSANNVWSTTNVSSQTRWSYIEIRAKLHDTDGEYEVRFNEETVIGPTTSADTKNGGTKTTFDSVRLRCATSNITYDDVYVCTGSDSAFQGDCIVETVFPNGNGDSSQFVGSDGNSTDNYLLVDEATPSATDYVGSSTVGNQDLYQLGNISRTTGTVKAVMHVAAVAKTDMLAAMDMKILNKRSAVNKSPSIIVPHMGYLYHSYLLETDPETSAPWVATDIASLQSGIEVCTSTAAPSDVIAAEPFNDFTTNGWVASGSPTPAIIAGGRTSNGVSLVNNGGSFGVLTYSIPSGLQSDWLVVGFAWKTDSFSNSPRLVEFFSDTNSTSHHRPFAQSDGSIGFYTTTNQGSTAAGVLTLNTWHYFEIMVRLGDGTSGFCQMRVDGTVVKTFTDLDTKVGGTKIVYDAIRLGPRIGLGVVNTVYDDLYIVSGVGGAYKGSITP